LTGRRDDQPPSIDPARLPFDALLETAPDAILLVDPGGRIEHANARAEELFGYERDELIGSDADALFSERFRELHRRHRADYSTEAQIRPIGLDDALYGLRKDGSEFAVEISLNPVPLNDRTLVITIVRDVSERRDSDLRFRRLIESAPDAILLVDAQGKIALANRRCEELFGYVPEELLGRPVEVLVPERFRGDHGVYRASYLAEPRARPMGVGLELYALRKDGSEFPVEISLSPLSSGPETLICTIVRDVTRHKAVEAERLQLVRAQAAQAVAEAAAARLRGMHDVTEAALGHLSLDELLQEVLEPVRASLDASAARLLLFDDDRGELVVRASVGLAPTEVAVPIGDGLAGTIAEQADAGVFEVRASSLDPQLAEAGLHAVVGAPLRVAGNAFGAIYAAKAAPDGFTEDDAQLLQVFADRIALAISHAWLFDAEREARAATEAAQTRLSEMIADLDAIVWEADTPDRSRLTFVGGHGLGMLGYPLEQWTGERDFWRRLIHPDDIEHTLLYFAEAAAEQRDHELEYRLRAADGRFVWVNDKVRVVDGEPGAPRVRGVMVDVTERRELAARLLHSQKMEAVGQLAGGVAHDFNNLLTVISGFANLLSARLGAEAGRELEEIRRAADQAASLTRQLLAFSRRDQRESELVDLNELVSNIEQMIRRLIGEDIRLTITGSTEPALVEADPSRLEQVFVNLVVNARDAMPRGGEIRVALSTTDARDAANGASELSPERHVLLRVSDTGGGMSEATMARIFEPFFTTKPLGKGTGLGLATVYAVVEQAGGTISVDSEPGRGTEFTVSLPAATAPAAAPIEEGVATILVAEDEPALRTLARVILEQEKYRVLEAASGQDALEVAAQYPGTIDLVLTDIVMPGVGGPELVAELSSVRPELDVIYMSGYADSRIAGRDESHSLLRKPFDREQLIELVRATLEKRSAARSGSSKAPSSASSPSG
jgi:two-component system cell cycle sensor histidine kinase/response regulator CckA